MGDKGQSGRSGGYNQSRGVMASWWWARFEQRRAVVKLGVESPPVGFVAGIGLDREPVLGKRAFPN